MQKKIEKAQKLLQEEQLDGWLLFDFGKRNDLACSFLEIQKEQMVTRRFFYFIPQKGNPVKIVHAIESEVLDAWPGEKHLYFAQEELKKNLQKTLSKHQKIAMEYSPSGEIPYVSKVDAGTFELVRSFCREIVSSQNILPHFTAVLTEKEIASQKKAATSLDQIVATTWKWIATQMKSKGKTTEYEVQQKVLEEFSLHNLETVGVPICAVNEHSADPHYTPTQKKHAVIRSGDFLLLDLWGKLKKDRSVFADITRVATIGCKPTHEQQKIFVIVKKARDEAVSFLQKKCTKKQKVEGREVDQIARKIIEEAGYKKYFLHKTGHSIEFSLHGSGAHLDSIETIDRRYLLPGTCFSIEPGIYLPNKFGVRLEFDVILTVSNQIEITGGVQNEISFIG